MSRAGPNDGIQESTMTNERDLGVQPIAALMARHELTPGDLVGASSEQLTHKMVARAVKGRRLTANVMAKVLNALNRATEGSYTTRDLFNYEPLRRGAPDAGD